MYLNDVLYNEVHVCKPKVNASFLFERFSYLCREGVPIIKQAAIAIIYKIIENYFFKVDLVYFI